MHIQVLTFTWPISWTLWGFGEHCRTTDTLGGFPHFKGGRGEAAHPLSLGILWGQDMESSPWLCPDPSVNMAQGSLGSTHKVAGGERACPVWETSSNGFRHRMPLGKEWQGKSCPWDVGLFLAPNLLRIVPESHMQGALGFDFP